ncbi:snRNA-activating protein complex subunit 2 isoform X1 [Phalacrocorax carbo]|uniref:snRNA-activating protein complex subunit 2 isoform X1 n=1 Tax=Phalacrocorax carbo TaxID=9209 RepID=UPI00311A1A4A
MKPPLRPRLAPARYVTGPGAAAEPERSRATWSVREKRSLLAGLRAQAALGLPDPQPRALRERLPRRSEAEILSFLCRLRGRAAREAVRTQYRHCLEQQRHRRAHIPAPIEVWLELAEMLAEGLEEATAAAFSQVLTVAATEPLTLLHSVPPRPTSPTAPLERGGSAPVVPAAPLERGGSAPGVSAAPLDRGGSAPAVPATPPSPPGQPHAPTGFTVDFQRVYEYLARLCRGGKGPALPPGESAVVLALLGSLPQELGVLDRAALQGHLRSAYGALTAPRPPEGPPTPPPPSEGAPSAPLAPSPPASPWRGVGLCPLNLFLVPLRLLARAEPSG